MLKLTLLLVCTISLQLFTSHCALIKTTEGTENTQNINEIDSEAIQLTDIISEFLQSAFNILKSASNDEITKLISTVDAIEEAFSEDSSLLATYVLAGIQIFRKFITGGFYIRPQTAITIIQKGMNHYKKEPDTLKNNLTKVGYKLMKTVGSDVQNWGGVLATGVKMLKDLQKDQASISNSVAGYVPIPYFRTGVKTLNSAISSSLEILHLGTQVGSKIGGEKFIETGDKLKMRLREKKQRKLEKEKQEKEEELKVAVEENNDAKKNKIIKDEDTKNKPSSEVKNELKKNQRNLLVKTQMS